MRKLNIAVVVGSFPELSETFILNQITDLIDKGHNVKIFSYKKGNQALMHQAVTDYQLLDNTIYYPEFPVSLLQRLKDCLSFLSNNRKKISFKKIVRIFNPFGNFRNAINLRSFYNASWFLTKGDFDIIHVHFANKATLIADLMEKKVIEGSRLVTSFHGYDIIPAKVNDYNKEYDLVFRKSAAITSNSTFTTELIAKTTADTRKIFLLPEGLRTNQYKLNTPRSALKNEVHILFCGRLVEFKAPDLAVEIMRVLVREKNYRHIKLSMIGLGPLQKKVETLIEEYGLKDYIYMWGGRKQEEVIQLMNQADIFLLPGIHQSSDGRAENQGLVIQEAQALELPVVVSDAGGMKYGLIENETGFVVREKDVQGFVDKLELLINNRELRNKMGVAGRKFVEKNFDTVILGNRLEKVYYDIIGCLLFCSTFLND